MLVSTSRFGAVEVDEQRIITFAKGILGFPSFKQYVLLQPNEEGCFYWLQSVDTPELAFVVADPSMFVPTYRVPLRREQMEEMGLRGIEDAQVLVIINRYGNTLTGNLQGPLVINTVSKTAEQLVLSDKRYHPRVPLAEVGEPALAMTA